MKLAAHLCAILLATSPAAAQGLQEIERREVDLVAAWEKSPLLFRTATFVTERAAIYGSYSPRGSSSYKRGEPLVAYLEPVGYGWKQDGDAFVLGISLDVVFKSRDGKVLGGQEKFLNSEQRSRYRLRELMLNVTLNLGTAPPGDYVAEFVARDHTGKSGSVSMPFTITE